MFLLVKVQLGRRVGINWLPGVFRICSQKVQIGRLKGVKKEVVILPTNLRKTTFSRIRILALPAAAPETPPIL